MQTRHLLLRSLLLALLVLALSACRTDCGCPMAKNQTKPRTTLS